MGESKRGIEGGGYESGRVGAINTITLSGLHANYKDDQRPELIVMSLAFRNMDLMSILPNLPSMMTFLCDVDGNSVQSGKTNFSTAG